MLRKNNILLVLSSALFVIAEGILGYLVQTTSGDTCTYVCMASVVLACVYVALSFRKNGVWVFTQIALVMTVCADSFLTELFTPQNSREIGVLFFCVAQTAYFMRILSFQEKKNAASHTSSSVTRLPSSLWWLPS